mmetsp:Transcript_4585/g.15810  ORF Transcript_4585/g.15810 Transcript_4585/m.15810 type:complete len:339 (+) Transcript_4585:670-1686(+)
MCRFCRCVARARGPGVPREAHAADAERRRPPDEPDAVGADERSVLATLRVLALEIVLATALLLARLSRLRRSQVLLLLRRLERLLLLLDPVHLDEVAPDESDGERDDDNPREHRQDTDELARERDREHIAVPDRSHRHHAPVHRHRDALEGKFRPARDVVSLFGVVDGGGEEDVANEHEVHQEREGLRAPLERLFEERRARVVAAELEDAEDAHEPHRSDYRHAPDAPGAPRHEQENQRHVPWEHCYNVHQVHHAREKVVHAERVRPVPVRHANHPQNDFHREEDDAHALNERKHRLPSLKVGHRLNHENHRRQSDQEYYQDALHPRCGRLILLHEFV